VELFQGRTEPAQEPSDGLGTRCPNIAQLHAAHGRTMLLSRNPLQQLWLVDNVRGAWCLLKGPKAVIPAAPLDIARRQRAPSVVLIPFHLVEQQAFERGERGEDLDELGERLGVGVADLQLGHALEAGEQILLRLGAEGLPGHIAQTERSDPDERFQERETVVEPPLFEGKFPEAFLYVEAADECAECRKGRCEEVDEAAGVGGPERDVVEEVVSGGWQPASVGECSSAEGVFVVVHKIDEVVMYLGGETCEVVCGHCQCGMV
jgi:hypothetical protein